MRDSQVYDIERANIRRAGLLLGQHEFLKTRQEAFERVLAASTWRDRLTWALWPKDLLTVVAAVQAKLLSDAAEQRRQASTKLHLVSPHG